MTLLTHLPRAWHAMPSPGRGTSPVLLDWPHPRTQTHSHARSRSHSLHTLTPAHGGGHVSVGPGFDQEKQIRRDKGSEGRRAGTDCGRKDPHNHQRTSLSLLHKKAHRLENTGLRNRAPIVRSAASHLPRVVVRASTSHRKGGRALRPKTEDFRALKMMKTQRESELTGPVYKKEGGKRGGGTTHSHTCSALGVQQIGVAGAGVRPLGTVNFGLSSGTSLRLPSVISRRTESVVPAQTCH